MHVHLVDPNRFLYLAFYALIICITQVRKGKAFLQLSDTERTTVDYLEKGSSFLRTLAFLSFLVFLIAWATPHFVSDKKTVGGIIIATFLILLFYWFSEQQIADRRLLDAGVSAHYISARRISRYALPVAFLVQISYQIGTHTA